jgi:hypothetical protein
MHIAARLILRRFARIFVPALCAVLVLAATAEHSVAGTITWAVALGALPAAVSSGFLFAELVSRNELQVIESAGISPGTIMWRLFALVAACYVIMLFVACVAGQSPLVALGFASIGILGSLSMMSLTTAMSLAWARRDETAPWLGALACCALFYTFAVMAYAFPRIGARRIIWEGIFLSAVLLASLLTYRLSQRSA